MIGSLESEIEACAYNGGNTVVVSKQKALISLTSVITFLICVSVWVGFPTGLLGMVNNPGFINMATTLMQTPAFQNV